jgi:RecA/RadA recombinase
LRGVRGLDLSEDMFTMIQSTEEKILHAKDFLNILEAAVMNHPKCTCIVDSFSALVPEMEQTDGVGTSTRGGVGVLMGQHCRQLGQILPLKRSVIMGITQLYSNTSGWGSPIAEKGGLSIQYQGDVKLRCKSTEDWMSSGKKVGQKVTWIAEYTATGAPPGSEIESHLRYGIGVDDVSEGIQLATDLGLIEQSGKWQYFTYLKNYPTLVGNWNEEVEKKCKADGKDNAYLLLMKNPEWLEALQIELNKLTGATDAV